MLQGVNTENVIVPVRAQSPSPAANDGGGLAAFDGEQHSTGHSQFQNQPLWI